MVAGGGTARYGEDCVLALQVADQPIGDGTEFDCKAGDVSLLPSGHDAWVVGNEPAVVVDFQGMLDYAKAGH